MPSLDDLMRLIREQEEKKKAASLNALSSLLGSPQPSLRSLLTTPVQKRKVFVSYDHDDCDQVNGFLGLRNIPKVNFDFINKKLDYEVQSANDAYVRKVIREKFWGRFPSEKAF